MDESVVKEKDSAEETKEVEFLKQRDIKSRLI